MSRILGITALVGLLGGLAGVFGSAVAMAVSLLFVDVAPEGPDLRDILLIATTIGFAVGGLFAPVSAWLFLRRVPLWRASVETAFVAALAFTAGLLLAGGFGVASALGAFGALAAAARLKRAYRHTASLPAGEEQLELPAAPRS